MNQRNLCDIRTLFCIPLRAGSDMPAFLITEAGEEARESSVRSVHKTEEGGGEEGEAAKATECPAGKRGRAAAHLKGAPNTNATVRWGRCRHRWCSCFDKEPTQPGRSTWEAIGKRGSPRRAAVAVSEILGLVVA